MSTVKEPGFEVTIAARTFREALTRLIEVYEIDHVTELPAGMIADLLMREVGQMAEIVTYAVRHRR